MRLLFIPASVPDGFSVNPGALWVHHADQVKRFPVDGANEAESAIVSGRAM
jgi:hypothetical protein